MFLITNMNKLFLERLKDYYQNDYDEFLKLIDKEPTHGFIYNEKIKVNNNLTDFDYEESNLTKGSFYHNHDNIGKTLAYELGLIYPQDIAASIPAKIPNYDNVKIACDLCAAPGGKSIGILNKLKEDSILISNDYSYARVNALCNNLERMGFGNAIITCKKPKELVDDLYNQCDLVILDAPCSGEGMIRKYPEILDEYNVGNINNLAKTQEELLEVAYDLLNENGQLIYSTCTYAYEEDEDQVLKFLDKHKDMKLCLINDLPQSQRLPGTVKLSFLNNTEGQFIAYLIKESISSNKVKYKKTINDNIVDSFINDNLNIKDYYLYKQKDKYYLSMVPLIDINNNVVRYGVDIGEIVKNRFEPNHMLYRINELNAYYKFNYELDKDELLKFIKGEEVKCDLDNHYYHLTYLGYSVGFAKASNGVLKNKYPKGLRKSL